MPTVSMTAGEVGSILGCFIRVHSRYSIRVHTRSLYSRPFAVTLFASIRGPDLRIDLRLLGHTAPKNFQINFHTKPFIAQVI
jgi:hypothetical protein